MTSHPQRSSQAPAATPCGATPANPHVRYEIGDLVLGRYRLEAPIGFGGMGTVWRAHNESLDSLLALKLMRDVGAGEWPASGSERLLVEAKTTASLRHPSIVRVFDFGQTERGDSFIAMELLGGESLRERLDNHGPMSAFEAVRTLLPILAGLECAHARGIIHRDLKPDNIFLSRDDAGGIQPKVLDFGIAMSQGAVSRLTTAGVLLGSPSYMSPEQALGEEKLDLRVDLWGLAVVLYEAIGGRTPWQARSCPVLLRAIVDDAAPSLVGTGGVDNELWQILSRGLAKNREDRWGSARGFGTALAEWLVRAGVTTDLSGASLQSIWLRAQAEVTRPSLRSIPPSCSTATAAHATWNLTGQRGQRGARRSNWAAASMAAVAAALLLWGGRVRTQGADHSAATASHAVAVPARGVWEPTTGAMPAQTASDPSAAAMPQRAASDPSAAAMPQRAGSNPETSALAMGSASQPSRSVSGEVFTAAAPPSPSVQAPVLAHGRATLAPHTVRPHVRLAGNEAPRGLSRLRAAAREMDFGF